MFALLLTPAYAPFAVAFLVMIGVGLIELLGADIDHGDADLDVMFRRRRGRRVRRSLEVRDVLRDRLGGIDMPSSVRVTVDVDPYSFM